MGIIIVGKSARNILLTYLLLWYECGKNQIRNEIWRKVWETSDSGDRPWLAQGLVHMILHNSYHATIAYMSPYPS